MEEINLAPELLAHQERLGPDVLKWLNKQIPYMNELNLSEFIEKLFEIIENNEVIDAEIAYLACKGGVMTGNLTKVISFDNSKHPGVQAYVGLAHLFMNNFTVAEDYIEQAKLEIESLNDIYLMAEINGIQIYLDLGSVK